MTTPAALREAHDERLRAFIHDLRLGVLVHGPDGVVLDVNRAAVDLLGRPAESLIGTRPEWDAIQEDGSAIPALLHPVSRALATGLAVRDVVMGLSRPQAWERVWVLADALPQHGPGGALDSVVWTMLDITARRRLESNLQEQGQRDSLTGAFNRRYLAEFARRLEAGGEASWGCIAVDVQNLKDYNEQHGHPAGDELLVRMTRMLMLQVRAGEAVVRIGGDEFVVLLTGVDGTTIGTVVHRIAEEARQRSPVPFSLGWAVREGGEQIERTVARAEAQRFAVALVDTVIAQRRASGAATRPPAAAGSEGRD